MSVVVKSLIAVGGLGTLTGAGFAINHFYGGESIESFLKKSNGSKEFLAKGTKDLNAILTTYESSTRFKPKDSTGKPVDKDNLVNWCKEAVKGKYYGKDDANFKGVNSWCFINTNSFADQLKNRGNKKVSAQDSKHKDWTDAWGKYKLGRNDVNLKITYSEKQGDLNGNDEAKGAAALKAWCDSKVNTKFYVDDADKEFNKFDHWCPKVDA
ncbi:hypothetical protein A6V39_04425 [Candidatus Mycoplasma haematobovis]|uniref:Uncharacterized protein n=1 Tax=Candidatus Mycoplasma haematobovis TaxID=432608 RepID=A0A1A9QEM5_9MOLU|nr:hypothetical protein [Candidatus Mycoplasma haematobovis]OAL10130.1 hypothetical protein A6V39_04425 [Candidatus Mycoplasma haematobovis]